MIARARPTELRTLQVGKGWFAEEPGGLNRYYHDLIERLPELGVDVTGLVAADEPSQAQLPATVRTFAPRRASLPIRLVRARSAVRRWLADHDDLVVGHFALYVAPCLDLLARHPFVFHFHGPWADESRSEGANGLTWEVKRRLERAVYHRAARLIVLSQAFARILEGRYGVPPDRISIVPGGIDTARFAPVLLPDQARLALGWPVDRPIVLVVRRLVNRMGLEDLIRAVRSTVERLPDVLVLIAGSGHLASVLAGRIAALHLEPNVRLIGFVRDRDLPLAYRAADVSVVPSVALEGFGLVVVESLAAGTPVLVRPVGGLPEAVAGLGSDCIVDDFAPEALGEAIAEALQGHLSLPSEAACIEHARSHFDWSTVGKAISRVYAEAAR